MKTHSNANTPPSPPPSLPLANTTCNTFRVYKLRQALGVGHVRGLLLHGPPGCGKTLLARELSRRLGARPPKLVSGPEILDKWVGEAERKVRLLFLDAELEHER